MVNQSQFWLKLHSHNTGVLFCYAKYTLHSAKHKPSRGVWGHAPPGKLLKMDTEIESETTFKIFTIVSLTIFVLHACFTN